MQIEARIKPFEMNNDIICNVYLNYSNIIDCNGREEYEDLYISGGDISEIRNNGEHLIQLLERNKAIKVLCSAMGFEDEEDLTDYLIDIAE